MKKRLIIVIAIIAAALALNGCVADINQASSSQNTSIVETNSLPWDYRIVEASVGDLIGSDMTIVPDNELLPNDENYATGDKVWTLQYMEAIMGTTSKGSNSVTLTEWKTIKSFKNKKDADADLAELKVNVTTEVDLVGAYRTDYKGNTRYFGIITLPSGHDIKQPIDAKRYKSFKSAKTVKVKLEEVHDYTNYEKAFAKFRGWAS
ncbi:hypothetical protein [Paenibacillus sp. NEAU-GSW1]|uniref:hypothetical protein n=1 Tax=Paenibacillus sp. NEAU-GSW1 TaxID=2682486 RepID=UPI0012E1A09D|nr:hypothetical protein [Paenibacillus sp. NEAU-GSW1]MUT68703.1 signal peptide protein [Paenibacillus sp. NEAU-GSW1]